MIVFQHFPKTNLPPEFITNIISVFKNHYSSISTENLEKGLESDTVLSILRTDLQTMGFEVEKGKKKEDKIFRPVFFGENGVPSVTYEIDAYHPEWKCGLEIEAGRAWKGNAFYRDLILGLVMVNVEFLIIAVPITYKYIVKGKPLMNTDYKYASGIASTLYSHRRFKFPYELTLVGY